MKGREFAKLARRHLMPHLPGFALKDGLIHALPVDRVWRRFHLYPSGFTREDFTVYCAVSPLYVPDSRNAYPFGLGDRLPILAGLGDRWWTWQPGDDEAEATMMGDLRELMINVGVPHLRELRDPAAVAERLLNYPEHLDHAHVAEALAYSLILAGSYELAREKLELLRSITLDNEERATWWADLHAGSRKPPDEDWVIAVGKRGAAVAEALERSPQTAIGLLDEWNEEQLAALRLPRYA
jgi:hypothetical protein